MLTGQNEATFEAYDGVELRLLNGRVVRCASLTVAEAVRYLRVLSLVETDPTAHERFIGEFPGRLGIEGERLVDLGLEVDGFAFGDLTYSAAVELVALQVAGAWATDVRARSRAQCEFLDRFPAAVGLAPTSPAQVMAEGRRFTDAIYLMIYGLAEDFCSHLISAPGSQVLEVTGTVAPGLSSSSTSVSTT